MIFSENRWFFNDFLIFLQLSPCFPQLFPRKMGAGNMKNGGGSPWTFQNTQELLRSIKTRKVRWVNVSHFANCTILVFESSTNGSTYSSRKFQSSSIERISATNWSWSSRWFMGIVSTSILERFRAFPRVFENIFLVWQKCDIFLVVVHEDRYW